LKTGLYKSEIIKNLFFSNKLTSTELSEKMDKSVPLVNKMIMALLEEGYIQETGLGDSTGGRRPLTYSLKPELLYVVSVAVDQLYTRIAIIDIGNMLTGSVKKIDLVLKDNPTAHVGLLDLIKDTIEKSGIEKTRIAGIGIGMPGFVDAENGINYTFFNQPDKGIAEFISERIELPVFIENDSSLIALAEHKFGAAVDAPNAMVINMSWGVGLGLVLKGELFRGDSGFAGEFSHIPLFNNNKLCRCGKNGCLETEASMLVIVERAIEGLKTGRSSVLKNIRLDNPESACEAIMDAARMGDQFSVELLSEVGYHIGRGLAILIHLLNPAMIIISGRGSGAGNVWKAPVQQALNEHCIPRLAEKTIIVISNIGQDAEIWGAASLVMEHFQKVVTSKKILVDPDDSGMVISEG
jgi:predicted NBD/HSP70 family sugar kinase